MGEDVAYLGLVHQLLVCEGGARAQTEAKARRRREMRRGESGSEGSRASAGASARSPFVRSFVRSFVHSFVLDMIQSQWEVSLRPDETRQRVAALDGGIVLTRSSQT